MAKIKGGFKNKRNSERECVVCGREFTPKSSNQMRCPMCSNNKGNKKPRYKSEKM